MKINELTRFMEGLAQGLTAIAPKASEGLNSITRALTPFSDMTVEQLSQFLTQCDEYQRTGIIPGGKKSPAKASGKTASVDGLSVEAAVAQFRGLLAEINQGSVTTAKIDALAALLNRMKKPDLDRFLTSVEIAGKAKSKGEAVDKIRTLLLSQAQMYIKVSTF